MIPIFGGAVAAALMASALVVTGCGTSNNDNSGASDSGAPQTDAPSQTSDAGAGDGAACVVSTAGGVGDNNAGYGCGEAGVPGFCDNGVRQEPPTCNPTVDALLQRTPVNCASKSSTHSYNLDSDPMDPDSLAHRGADMCNLKGAVYWVADMDIDCDGRMTDVCPGTGVDMDPSYQNDTFVHTNASTNDADGGGMPLASSLDQYVVIPSDNWMGVTPGAVVAVIYGTKVTYAVFGDTGPTSIIGEGSHALAEALGIPPSPANGGVVGNTVTYIAFTGTGAVPSNIEDRTAIETLGKSLTDKFLMDNPPVDISDGGTGVLPPMGPRCGSNGTCAVGETCCVTPGPAPDGGSAGSFGMATCVASASACTGVALACAGLGDCPNGATQMCCATGDLTMNGGGSSCQTVTACPTDQVCLSSSECPSGMRCRKLTGGDGIRTCVASATDGGAGEGGPGEGGAVEAGGGGDDAGADAAAE